MRLLLKLSGEALSGADGDPVDTSGVAGLVKEIGDLVNSGGQLAVVLGGGNLLRGASLARQGMDRISADHMGMLATIMNGIAFRDALLRGGVPAALFAAVQVPTVAPGFSRDAAVAAMERGEVAVLAGGTGNPLFTTDTASCLRAIELGADRVLKATKVDGIYSADPMKDPDAERFDSLSYDEVIDRKLEVMDLAAFTLCRDHDLPIVVFDMAAPGALTQISNGAKVGTLVDGGT